jgi:hypothetical protein
MQLKKKSVEVVMVLTLQIIRKYITVVKNKANGWVTLM